MASKKRTVPKIWFYWLCMLILVAAIFEMLEPPETLLWYLPHEENDTNKTSKTKTKVQSYCLKWWIQCYYICKYLYLGLPLIMLILRTFQLLLRHISLSRAALYVSRQSVVCYSGYSLLHSCLNIWCFVVFWKTLRHFFIRIPFFHRSLSILILFTNRAYRYSYDIININI